MIDLDALRGRFPALARTLNGRQVVYADGPGGTQVPRSVIEAMTAPLREGVSNTGGPFPSSDLAAEIAAAARSAVADLLGAEPGEVVFGQNMTSLNLALSRALARTLELGDEIVVTNLDHDANVTPWRLAAADRGATVRTASFDRTDGMLSVEAVAAAIGPRTRVVAVTAASNALGSMTPLQGIVAAAHDAGALAVVDAVHAVPHRALDLSEIGADALLASAYKFYGPHTGLMVGRNGLLSRVAPYKLTAASDEAPGSWETGTPSFESLAGVTAAIDHIAGLGEGDDRRGRITDAMARIAAHEQALSARFLAGLSEMPEVRVHGISDPARLDERAPTFALGVEGRHPRQVSEALGERGIFVWDGHYYATDVMRHLGVLESGGLVRIGFSQYTTPGEVDRILEELAAVAGG
jgi:cysteine desulfurase family protein (TIGR01976 family)